MLSSQIRGHWCIRKDTEVREVREVPDAILVNSQAGMTSAYDAVLDQDIMKADDHQKADDSEVPVHLWNSMFMKAWAADQRVQHSLAL